jgi:pyruvate dehydrogenase E2 component (dihydrolipoamide acetyltransferase)
MFSIDNFTAIINAPESAILAVGSVEQVPVVVNGQLAVGWRMKVTMTCDHRVIDGALGAKFLLALRTYVESPAMLVL